MGLSLCVGMYADLLDDKEGVEWLDEQIESLNALLERNDLQRHVEPRTLSPHLTFSCDMWGYSGLHKLRRVAAHLAPKKTLFGKRSGKLPIPIADRADKDPLLLALYQSSTAHIAGPFRHLIHHSDAEGFYVPQDFSAVLISEDIPGGYAGSTQRLHADCVLLARALGIPDGLDPESDEVIDAAESGGSQAEGWRAYGVETHACLQLLHACEASMKSGALLVFN